MIRYHLLKESCLLHSVSLLHRYIPGKEPCAQSILLLTSSNFTLFNHTHQKLPLILTNLADAQSRRIEHLHILKRLTFLIPLLKFR